MIKIIGFLFLIRFFLLVQYSEFLIWFVFFAVDHITTSGDLYFLLRVKSKNWGSIFYDENINDKKLYTWYKLYQIALYNQNIYKMFVKMNKGRMWEHLLEN